MNISVCNHHLTKPFGHFRWLCLCTTCIAIIFFITTAVASCTRICRRRINLWLIWYKLCICWNQPKTLKWLYCRQWTDHCVLIALASTNEPILTFVKILSHAAIDKKSFSTDTKIIDDHLVQLAILIWRPAKQMVIDQCRVVCAYHWQLFRLVERLENNHIYHKVEKYSNKPNTKFTFASLTTLVIKSYRWDAVNRLV
jgi:hypothetical protein